MKIDRETAKKLGLQFPGTRRTPRPEAREQDATRQALFVAACLAHGLPEPVAEYAFAAPDRQWRFDYCWGEFDIALEIQGGLYTGGRHVRGAALLREYEKLNEAVARGWSVLFATPQQVDDGSVFALLRRVLGVNEL